MGLEWVVVEYPRVRDVFVDGRRWDVTNELFPVSEGTHRFDLGMPRDYTPPKKLVPVTGTSEQDPLIIRFEPV